MNVVYADNAATTKLDMDAFEAMKPYLLDEYGNASQPYFLSYKPKKALKEARKIIAECINAEPEEIYFTSCGTESDNWAIKGIGYDGDIVKIITSSIEHHAILNSCKNATLLPVNECGEVLPSILEELFSDRKSPVASCETTLCSVMYANNEIGTIEPIKELARVAHKYGAYFHTDAVQALGHIKIDVKELDVDLLSASAHKFNGPKGIGFLYVKNGTPISSFISGGSQEHRLRAGTENVAFIVGMAIALKKNCETIEKNTKHISYLEAVLLKELVNANINYIRNGSECRIPGNISLSFENANGEMILHRLDLMGICVSTGSACDGNSDQISHVLKAIKLDENFAKGTIRISLGKDNTEEEVIKIAKCINKILNT